MNLSIISVAFLLTLLVQVVRSKHISRRQKRSATWETCCQLLTIDHSPLALLGNRVIKASTGSARNGTELILKLQECEKVSELAGSSRCTTSLFLWRVASPVTNPGGFYYLSGECEGGSVCVKESTNGKIPLDGHFVRIPVAGEMFRYRLYSPSPSLPSGYVHISEDGSLNIVPASAAPPLKAQEVPLPRSNYDFIWRGRDCPV